MKSLAMIGLFVVSAITVGGQRIGGGQNNAHRQPDWLSFQQRFQQGGELIQYAPSSEVTRLEARIQQLEDTVRSLQRRLETLEQKAITPRPGQP